MTDRISKEQRSRNMAAIKSKNTKPEIFVRKLLWSNGIRYRLHDTRLPGKPDLYIPKYKTAVFINGCFWHRHAGCKYAYTPKSNIQFWETKFYKNVENDERVKNNLFEMGYKVLIVWECRVRGLMKKDAEEQLKQNFIDDIHALLKSDQKILEL